MSYVLRSFVLYYQIISSVEIAEYLSDQLAVFLGYTIQPLCAQGYAYEELFPNCSLLY